MKIMTKVTLLISILLLMNSCSSKEKDISLGSSKQEHKEKDKYNENEGKYKFYKNLELLSINVPKSPNTGRLFIEHSEEKIKEIWENNEGIYVLRGNEYNWYNRKTDDKYGQSFTLIRIDKKFHISTPKNTKMFYLGKYDYSRCNVYRDMTKEEFHKRRKIAVSQKSLLIKKFKLKKIPLHKCNKSNFTKGCSLKGYSKKHNIFFTISWDDKRKGTTWIHHDIVEYVLNPDKKLYNDIYTIDRKINSLKNKMKNYKSIKYKDFFTLITGNTLIAESERYCPEGSSKQSCLKVVILDLVKNKKLKSFKRYPATIIYPDQKRIEKSEYGLWAMNAIYLGLHTGVATVPINNNYHPFESLVFVHKNNQNKFLFKNPVTKEMVDISLVQGHNTKFLDSAKQNDYKKIDVTGRTTIGLAILNKVAEKTEKFISEMNSASSENRDLQNLCLANNNSDYKSNCYSIKDKDLKNLCLANNNSDNKSNCYSIKDKDLQNLCLANNYSDYKSNCYSIKDKNLQNLCLSNNYSDYKSNCYSIITKP